MKVQKEKRGNLKYFKIKKVFKYKYELIIVIKK